MPLDAATVYASAFRRGLRPEPRLTVSEWADRHRMLSGKASAEPGPWRTERTPYLRAIMDALSPHSPWERVVFMKGAQIGGTEAGNNWLGYIIHNTPAPTLAVSPTVDMAKRASRQRIEPLIEESPVLRSLVAPARARDSGNTVMSKDFPGGVLVLTGANSAVGLRSMPARFLFLDEVDAYPGDADGEGDPVALAMARTSTFGARRKVFLVSTPTVAGVSRIEAAYSESDQRRFFVPCPHCTDMAPLSWQRIRWPEGRPRDAHAVCEACGGVIEEHHKGAMLAAGEWRATAPGDGRTAGFHLSALYSPPGWFSWGEAAEQFTQAKDTPSRLKTFVNVVLGETWAERGDAPEWKRLAARRETYTRGHVPKGGLALTAGCDVHPDRLECEVVAWGRNRVSWSVDHVVIHGNPAQPDVWRELTDLLHREWPGPCGHGFRILKLAIDIGGHNTEAVYRFAATDPARIMAVKGMPAATVALGAASRVEVNRAGRKVKRGALLWPVGVSILKADLYSRLKLDPPDEGQPDPAGFCRFPDHPDEWFKQLCAEQLVKRTTRTGHTRLEWEQTRDRNEALDCRVYAMAAALAAGIERWGDADWHAAEVAAGYHDMPAPVPARRAVPVKSAWLAR